MLLSPALVISCISQVKQSLLPIGFSNKGEEHGYKSKKSRKCVRVEEAAVLGDKYSWLKG